MRTADLFGFPFGRAAAIAGTAFAVALFAGCGGDSDSESGSGGSGGGESNSLTASTDGEQIFAAANCASCHTLAAAGAEGRIGPNLDEDKPTADRVATAVAEGAGSMPSFSTRLSAEQIQAVADYVAQAAAQ